MLSILIPIYNYRIENLIKGLDQCLQHIDFDVEILCLEDGSTKFITENAAVCSNFNLAKHIVSSKNKGRITSRNNLAKRAKYHWLLFLDADVEVMDYSFLKNYSDSFSPNYEAIYGGCTYDILKPNQKNLLRWKYGKAYEDIDASIRNKAPYKHTISANFIIKKEVIEELYSKIKYEGYGYDILLGSLMESQGVSVLHINNPVIHKGLDDNTQFLKKVRNAVETSFKLQQTEGIQFPNSSLIKTFEKLKRLKLTGPVQRIFELYRAKLERNLLGSNPNIKLLQFYKLGYLCTLTSKV